jgi:hypothetical protein
MLFWPVHGRDCDGVCDEEGLILVFPFSCRYQDCGSFGAEGHPVVWATTGRAAGFSGSPESLGGRYVRVREAQTSPSFD